MRYDIENLWKEHSEAVYNFIRNRVNEEDDAKEVLQKVVIKAWKYFEKNTMEIRNMRAWFFQVSKNTITDFYRRRKTFVPQNDNMEIIEEKQADVYTEAAAYLEPLMKLLPKEYAGPLKMSEIEGIKQELVAKKLNMSHGAVRTKISRARAMLKKKIEECAVTEKDAAGKLMSFRIRTECEPLQQKIKTCANTNLN